MENKEKQINRTDNFGELSDTVSIPNKEKTISISKFEDIKLTIPCKKEMEEKQFRERVDCGIAYCEDTAVDKIKQDFKMQEEKHKRIEEMALLLQSYSDIKQSYYSGEWHSDDVYYGLAKSLYYNDLRIVPKDSVMLTREEWKQIKNSLYYSKEALEKKLVKERKEATKRFAEMLKEKFNRQEERFATDVTRFENDLDKVKESDLPTAKYLIGKATGQATMAEKAQYYIDETLKDCIKR